jgi:hypothetical protein
MNVLRASQPDALAGNALVPLLDEVGLQRVHLNGILISEDVNGCTRGLSHRAPFRRSRCN